MMKTRDLPSRQACAAWSNRILILSLLGIAYLTLFPFQFEFDNPPAYRVSPFFLGMNVKPVRYLDFFLNVLLFIPFGFGVSAQARKRGRNPRFSFFLALALGALTSYTVEFLQLFIPQRDSGWEDVFSNTMGSVSGFILFALFGGAILVTATKWEDSFISWLSVRRGAMLLAAYFAVWLGISALLQNETRLSNWDPECSLLVGNDASSQHPWTGKILLLQIWNRTLPEEGIRRLAKRESAEDASAGLLAAYDFRSSKPLQEQKSLLPPLEWIPESPQSASSWPIEFDGRAWLKTKSPVENLIREIKRTSHFTIRIVCAPATEGRGIGRILSLSRSSDNVNLNIRQQGGDLVLYLLNPLSEKRSNLVWIIPSVFEAGKVRDIVAIYDGSDAYLYVDGNRRPNIFHLGPGASLIHTFAFIQTGELEGYIIFYEVIVFMPAGILIGLAATKWFKEKTPDWWVLVIAWALPALLLDYFLAWESGRRIWVWNIALALGFGLMGFLLINSDWNFKNSRRPF